METALIDRVETSGADRPKMKCIRVLLVDDHFLVRKGLCKYLSHHLDIELVGEASDGEEAVKLTDLLNPDVVVMDINMPRMNGIEATSSIIRKHPYLGHWSLVLPRKRESRSILGCRGLPVARKRSGV